ncbi:hypothetical protein BH23GEM3_BH23GEM3_04950 [soil metagenome]
MQPISMAASRRCWYNNTLTRKLGVLVLAASLGACDALDTALRVEAPGIVDAEEMANPEHAQLLVTGAIADFECALGAYIVNGALLGNELRDASVTAARFSLDARNIDDASPYGGNSCTGNPPGVYVPIATAIWSSNNALQRLEGWTDAQVQNRTRLIGQAAAHSGYSLTLMGEGFCSAVITELGPEVQPAQIFEVAEQRFNRAIEAATAANDTETLNTAFMGRARIRLNRGNTAGAATDARAVLASNSTFQRMATASVAESRRWNRIGQEFFAGNVTVAPAYRNLVVDGEVDPRTRVVLAGDGHNRSDTVWLAAKIGTVRSADLRTGSVPVATWREAHLIIAEAEGGQEAVNRINILRQHHGLPLFQSADSDAIRRQVIEERQRELFLEGHHLNDLRRFNLPQLPAPGTNYRQGGVYGDVNCFPLPAVERVTNPNV